MGVGNQSSERGWGRFTELAAYGAPGVALSMFMLPMLVYIPPYYAGELGLDLTAVGAIFFIARLWDGVTDPVIGALSDRTRCRFGRRKIWIACSAPLLAISTHFLFRPPAGAGLLYLGLCLLLTYLLWTMVYIPYLSWGAELADDYDRRNHVSGFREGAFLIGGLIGTALPLVAFGAKAPDVGAVLALMGPVVAALVLVLVPVALVFCQEPGVEPLSKTVRDRPLRTLRKNKPFLRFMAAHMLVMLGYAIYNATSVFLIEHSLELPGQFVTLVPALFLSSMAGLPLVIAMAKVLEKHTTIIVALGINIAGFAYLSLIPAGCWALVFTAFVGMGLISSAFQVLPTSIVADAADFGALKGYGSPLGMYMAAYGMVMKLCMAAGVGVALPLLDLMGFVPSDSASTMMSIDVVRLVGFGAPTILFISAILLLWNFPIDRRRHDVIQRRLKRNLQSSSADGAQDHERDCAELLGRSAG